MLLNFGIGKNNVCIFKIKNMSLSIMIHSLHSLNQYIIMEKIMYKKTAVNSFVRTFWFVKQASWVDKEFYELEVWIKVYRWYITPSFKIGQRNVNISVKFEKCILKITLEILTLFDWISWLRWFSIFRIKLDSLVKIDFSINYHSFIMKEETKLSQLI